MDEKAIVPSATHEINFYGDLLLAALVENVPYVALRPITDFLGIGWGSQYNRIQRDEILSTDVRIIVMTGADQKQREMLCLPLDLIAGWLFGVDARRVKPDLKEKLLRYKRDCYRILAQEFQAELQSLTKVESGSTHALIQIREMGLAIAHMAEQQMEIEQRLTSRLDRAAQVVSNIHRRLTVVEQKLNPAMLVTDEQAEQISATVKALAELMTSKAPGKNHYQGIFAELYRRYGVSSYKNIRLEQYEKVLHFLEDWRQAASGENKKESEQ